MPSPSPEAQNVALIDQHEENDEPKDEAPINKVEEAQVTTSSESDKLESNETDAKKFEGEENAKVKKGLLDQPVLLLGKRQRHTVERLAVTSASPKKTNRDAVGSGAALSSIEFVNASLSKAHSESLKMLHKLCYNTTGTATKRKRDLKRFNGFGFDEQSSEFGKKKITAMKLTNMEINSIAKVLGTEKGHGKEDTDMGKKVPGSKKRKRSSSTRKGSRKVKEKAKGDGTNKRRKSAENVEHSGESGPDDEDESDEKEGNSDIKTPKSKRHYKKHSSGNSSKRHSGISKKQETPYDWGEGGPTNDEIESTINEILHSVDLVNCTMKQMCERISQKFPNLDMAVHKAELKERVKAALEMMEDA